MSSCVADRRIFYIDTLLLLFDTLLNVGLKLINQVLWDILLLRLLLLDGLDLARLAHILFLNFNSSLKSLLLSWLDNSLASPSSWHGAGMLHKCRISLHDIFLEARKFVLIVLLKPCWVSCTSGGRKSENVIISQKIIIFLIEYRLSLLCFYSCLVIGYRSFRALDCWHSNLNC